MAGRSTETEELGFELINGPSVELGTICRYVVGWVRMEVNEDVNDRLGARVFALLLILGRFALYFVRVLRIH